MRPIVEVINEHSERLMAHDQVVMVYESRTAEGEPCLKIGISCSQDELTVDLPERLEGYPVIVVETGEVAPR
ncbi:MAG: hypothetical protein HKN21_16920 [Candidatus Eisenbacteria bacterium]|uniref:Uncharacterized protein n=1 Tax=Eiseniibacteriota bacterium TaxID=2212470 RepID=A0A7Y2EAW8_UNCEI|nr:hypothetical protein [Candidatus Eisenbacteria bacterium]